MGELAGTDSLRGMKRPIILSLLFLAGCDQTPWQGWVYPDADNLTQSIPLAGFKTFEQCQEAAIGELRKLPDTDAGTYECGRGCRWDPEMQLNICKETRD